MDAALFTVFGLMGFLIFISYYVNRGVGEMSSTLKQFSTFMLDKAPAGAIDLFSNEKGAGPRTWINFGALWLVIGSVSAFIGAWHEYDPTALNSLSGIGWSYDDGSALTDFTMRSLLWGAIMSLMIGGGLVAHSRMSGGRMQSEANASLMALGWFGLTLVSLIVPLIFDWTRAYDAVLNMLYASMAGALLINTLHTASNREDAPLSTPSWFMILGFSSLVFGLAVNTLGHALGSTQSEWVSWTIVSGWVPLAFMLAVSYHIIGKASGQPIWSNSLTKASMLLLFCTIPPFMLMPANAGALLENTGVILITIGLFPILAASTNLLATIKGNAEAAVRNPGAGAAAGAAILLPVFAIGAFFTGLDTFVGTERLGDVNQTVNLGFLLTIGSLLGLAVIFESLPMATGKKMQNEAGARWAFWLAMVGGLAYTICAVMADWTAKTLTEAEVDSFVHTRGFDLFAAGALYGVVVASMIAFNSIIRTSLASGKEEAVATTSTFSATYTLTTGETSIRSLMARGVGIDTTIIVGAEESEESGSTIIEVSASLHNDEVDEFPEEEIEEQVVEEVEEESAEQEEETPLAEELVALAQYLLDSGKTSVELFNEIDIDSSGAISPFELREALANSDIADLPPWDMEALVSAMDLNGDGQIELPELDISMMMITNSMGLEAKTLHIEDDLKKMKKAELVTLAEEMGLDTKGTKSDLIERILSA